MESRNRLLNSSKFHIFIFVLFGTLAVSLTDWSLSPEELENIKVILREGMLVIMGGNIGEDMVEKYSPKDSGGDHG